MRNGKTVGNKNAWCSTDLYFILEHLRTNHCASRRIVIPYGSSYLRNLDLSPRRYANKVTDHLIYLQGDIDIKVRF
jgi:hypothetical protein